MVEKSRRGKCLAALFELSRQKFIPDLGTTIDRKIKKKIVLDHRRSYPYIHAAPHSWRFRFQRRSLKTE